MKLFFKHPTLFLLFMLMMSVLLYFLGSFVTNWSEVGHHIQDIAVFIGIVPAMGLFLLHTADGKRLKEKLIDLYIKPTDEEQFYWYEDGRVIDQSQEESEKILKPKKMYLKIMVAVFIILLILIVILTLQRGMASTYNVSEGMNILLDGVVHGDYAAVGEGGRILLSGLLADLQNILIIFALILFVCVVGYMIVRIQKRQKQYQFDKGDDKQKKGK